MTRYIGVPGNTTDVFKTTTYKLVDPTTHHVTGSREVSLEYFAYLKVNCDNASDHDACWAAKLPLTAGVPVTSTTLAADVAALSAADKDLYYKELVSLYSAVRGNVIARFRDMSIFCTEPLPIKDQDNEVFRDDLDANGDPAGADGPPSYTDVMGGNVDSMISAATANTATPGHVLNDIDEYAQHIVSKLLNCRVAGSPAYDATLFDAVLEDIKHTMTYNIRLVKTVSGKVALPR